MPSTLETAPNKILHVAISTPVADGFDYLLQKDADLKCLPGCRVRVPFGHREMVGVVVETRNHSHIAPQKLKSILHIIDQTPVLDEKLLAFARWASRYYHHPLGEVIMSMLPAALKQGKDAKPRLLQCWQICSRIDDGEQLKRAPKQWSIYQKIAKSPLGLSELELNKVCQNWKPAVRELEKKGLLAHSEQATIQFHSNNAKREEQLELNREQQNIVANIDRFGKRFKTWLIDGITGSGKTEIYIQLIKQALQRNEQCLVLVPEIGLTPQLLDRFSSRLNASVLTWHSAISDQQRHQIWYAAANGHTGIIIGTRSGVFLPLQSAGLIIIDEEHDSSLKQQEGFRYHARDLAIIRARQLDIPVVLGSATPSLDSLHNVRQQRFQMEKIRQRARGAQLPRMTLLDIHNAPVNQVLSQGMLQAIHKHLEQDSQVLLFLNRRGYAPLLLCNECEWKSECPRCDAHMTLHRSEQRLRCHHCGHEQPQPLQCPSCQKKSLQPIGTGTEQLEQVLCSEFPQHSVLRIDRDATRRKGVLEKHLALARNGQANILLGTQMLAKGHHFPNVTLVGIIGIDQALFSADFRGPEYMAQLIMQVAGRAGRAQRRGEVLIETRQPQHPLLRVLIEKGYDHFAELALMEREQAEMPPFSHLVLVRAEAVSPSTALNFLHGVTEQMQSGLPAAVHLLGPLPAPMARRAGHYRAQILLQSHRRSLLHQAVDHLQDVARKLPSQRKVRWSIDVDPVEMF